MSTETVQKTQTKTEVKTHESEHARTDRAEAVVRRNVLWALGAGVVPIPIVDVLAVTAVQVKMLKQLSDVYHVKFSEQLAKKLVGSFVGGLGSVGLGGVIGVALAGSLVKVIPAVGTTLGLVSVPIVAGAFTHAIGKIFMMHFESGGTLLNMDPRAMRSHFKTEFEKAKEVVTQIHTEQAKANKPA